MGYSYLKEKHKGLSLHRFRDNPEEELFAKKWEEMCDRGHLEWLLGKGDKQALDVTERDAQVAATVIQWLGSPVGRGFLMDLGYEKKEVKNKKNKWCPRKLFCGLIGYHSREECFNYER